MMIAALCVGDLWLKMRRAKSFRQFAWQNVVSWAMSMTAIGLLSATQSLYWLVLFAIASIFMTIHLYRIFSFSRMLERKGIENAIRDIVRDVYLRKGGSAHWRWDRFVPVHKRFERLGNVHMIPEIGDSIESEVAEIRKREPIRIHLR